MGIQTLTSPKEMNVLENQERAAHEEKALRAREYFELIQAREIQRVRKSEGRCVLCGRKLSLASRFIGSVRHPGCRTFHE